jgi:iron complex outermembrane receptor protein
MRGFGIFRRAENPRLICASALVIAIATGAPASAQESAPADDTQEVDDSEIVVTGFKNTDTSGALKGDVPVRDIPLTISGYNEEFISDLEVTQVADLYNYMVGVQRSGTTGYDISIRGFSSGAAARGRPSV